MSVTESPKGLVLSAQMLVFVRRLQSVKPAKEKESSSVLA